MDGVMILNTYSEISNSGVGLLFGVCALCCAGIFIGVVMICTETLSYFASCSLIFASIILLIAAFAVMPRTEFIQAVVDDSVPWVELTERYEVVKTEGRIVTMIEKVKKEEDQK